MNKIIPIYLLALLVITGCKSDDEEILTTENYSDLIIGEWSLSEYSSTYTINAPELTRIEEGVEFGYTIEFKNLSKEISVSGSFRYSVQETIVQNGNSNTSNFFGKVHGDSGEGFHVGKWSIVNNNLVTRSYDVDPNEEGAFDLTTDILELTTTTLMLTIDNSQFSAEGSNQAGTTTLKYVRQ